MGLDMYLTKRSGNKLTEVGYWRKANAIHKWFVKNVQDGDDNCNKYKVTIDQLEDLLNIVKIVAINGEQSLANNLLPTEAGFFFGETAYDEYYFECLKDTKEIIEKIIKEHQEKDKYFYQSSW